MRLIKPHFQDGFISSPLHFPAGMFFLLFFSFKTIENSNRQIRRLCADAANEFIRLISLIIPIWLFPFFIFSMTTFLQLGVLIWKNWWKQNVCKAQEWGGMYQRYKNINFNKIQRSNEQVAQDKEYLEGKIIHNDGL